MFQTRFAAVGFAVLAAALTAAAQTKVEPKADPKVDPKAPPAAQPLPEGVQAHKDLAYGPHERNRLDLFVPKSDKPLPLLIWVHGGGWQNGDKAGGGPAASRLSRGYAVASVNYRFSQTAPFPAQMADVRAAVRHLRANAAKYNLDPNAFGAWGSSAGGHLVALLGTASDVGGLDVDYKPSDVGVRVQAVVNYCGPTDLTASGANATSPSPVGKLLGGPPSEKAELAKLASPTTHVTKDDAPTLIVHGDADVTVPIGPTLVFADKLKAAGVPCELIVVKGGNHGAPSQAGAANKEKIDAFLDKNLKGK